MNEKATLIEVCDFVKTEFIDARGEHVYNEPYYVMLTAISRFELSVHDRLNDVIAKTTVVEALNSRFTTCLVSSMSAIDHVTEMLIRGQCFYVEEYKEMNRRFPRAR